MTQRPCIPSILGKRVGAKRRIETLLPGSIAGSVTTGVNHRGIAWRVIAVVCLVFVAVWPQYQLIFAQEGLSVQGQIINGTDGAQIAPGLTVSLHAFGPDVQSVDTVETSTDESGGFEFDNLTVTSDIGYALTMNYGGMTYSSLLGPEDMTVPIELTVYEPTQDLSVIAVEQHALVITGINEAEQQIDAVEFISLSNTSDRTLVPDISNVGQGQFSFMRFSLPPDTTNFDIQSDLVGGEVIPVGTGFGLTSPVTPGGHNLSFSFSFPFQGGDFSYQQNLLQGAGIYQVLIPERLGQVAVVGLESMPTIDVEGSAYRVWEGEGFAPGQGFPVELTNLPQPSLLVRMGQAMTGTEVWIITVPIILAVVLAAALLYGVFWSPRPSFVIKIPTQGSSNGSLEHRQSVIREIADLDERFQQGGVAENEYQARRAELKERIMTVTQPPEATAQE